jgi:hypothetical protein
VAIALLCFTVSLALFAFGFMELALTSTEGRSNAMVIGAFAAGVVFVVLGLLIV